MTGDAAVEITDEAVEAAARAMRPMLFDDDDRWPVGSATESARRDVRRQARAALEAALPYLTPQPECGAVDRTGERRCVFTPGHHEVENWTSHGDRTGWTWNDPPADGTKP